MAPYCRFVVALYVVFVNLVLWVPEAHDVVQSLTLAIKTPTFRKLYPLSGATRLLESAHMSMECMHLGLTV